MIAEEGYYATVLSLLGCKPSKKNGKFCSRKSTASTICNRKSDEL